MQWGKSQSAPHFFWRESAHNEIIHNMFVQTICFSKAHRHPPRPLPRRKTGRASSPAGTGVVLSAILVSTAAGPPWRKQGFAPQGECWWRLPLKRTFRKQSICCGKRSRNASNHLPRELTFFFAPKQTTHKLCVSSPVKKRGREEHTAWDATRSCLCLSSLVKVKIKSDNGQTTPNKTDRHRALAEWQKAYAVSTARTFMLPGLYVTPPVTFRPSIGLITHVIQSVVTQNAFPKHSTQLEFLKRNLYLPYRHEYNCYINQ